MAPFPTLTPIVSQRLSDERAERENGLKEIPPKEALLTMASIVFGISWPPWHPLAMVMGDLKMKHIKMLLIS